MVRVKTRISIVSTKFISSQELEDKINSKIERFEQEGAFSIKTYPVEDSIVIQYKIK